MKKIVCITGTRPQLIKHAVLIKELQKCFAVESLYTGQHYDYKLHEGLKKVLFTNQMFHNLKLEETVPAQRLGEMVLKIAAFLQVTQPDAVLVYGDTDSTVAGALAANKMKIRLIHVEAGERSFNLDMPEEHNRIITDALSDIFLCASHKAIEILHNEQQHKNVFYCGDLMKDLLLQTAELFQTPIVEEQYIYCTIHRNYTNQNIAKLKSLLNVLSTLNEIIIFPVHPATQTAINMAQEKNGSSSNIRLLPPIPYTDSIRYQKFARAIITDSGGIQKEAYWLKRRCITVRKETEWIETLTGNWNQLTYDDLSEIPELLNAPLHVHNADLYGNGTAAVCITQHLTHNF
jgi:UDP-GlcNAc3NAcA epimerase